MIKINKKILLLIIFIIISLIILLYFLFKKNENIIQSGPFFKGLFFRDYTYKKSKPKQAIKNIDFREDTNAAFKVPPDPPEPLDSLGGLTSVARF
jgi:hypothetical protein